MPIQKMNVAMYRPHMCGLSKLPTPKPDMYWYTSQPTATPTMAMATNKITQYSFRGFSKLLSTSLLICAQAMSSRISFIVYFLKKLQ